MNNQIILACDDSGNFLEYIPKELGHKGEGKRHLAISVLIVNKKGQVLLQKRKHKIFDAIWDITGATHPLHDPLSGEDESLDEATQRCLKDEWGIEGENLPAGRLGLRNCGAFNYFVKDGENCENEHCFIMTGEFNGEVKLSKNAGYEYLWMGKNKFLKDMAENADKYSAWAKEGVRILKRKGFFNK